jgi:F0F1-type ATP synthase delta subunit
MEEFDLSNFFQTKAQAHDFSLRLAAISEEVYETSFNLEKALLKQFGIQKKEAFISFLRDCNISADSTSALKAVLTKIQDAISASPVISLTLAIEPNDHIIKSLSDWFILNIKKHVLFDIHVDPSLIAGTTLTYRGKYLDFSIKPIFDKVIQSDMPQRKTAEKYDQAYYRKTNATPLNTHLALAQHP